MTEREMLDVENQNTEMCAAIAARANAVLQLRPGRRDRHFLREIVKHTKTCMALTEMSVCEPWEEKVDLQLPQILLENIQGLTASMRVLSKIEGKYAETR